MSSKLIGYPAAGVASQHPAPRVYTSVYDLVAAGITFEYHKAGDITGSYNRSKGTGTGHGSSIVRQFTGEVFKRGPRKGERKVKILSKRRGWRGKPSGKLATGSRAVGVGMDSEQSRAAGLESWLAPVLTVQYGEVSEVVQDTGRARARAAIVAAIDGEQGNPARLMAIAQRAAVKQAHKVFEFRSVRPSRSSIEEAAADAVAGVYFALRPGHFDKLTPDKWADDRVKRCIARLAARAAFRSLASWAVCGMTGDRTFTAGAGRQLMEQLGQDLGKVWGELGGVQYDGECDNANKVTTGATVLLPIVKPGDSLSRAAVALGQPVPGDSPAFDAAEWAARRAAAAWVYRVGYRQFIATLPRSKGYGTAKAAALSRCRVWANVIMGASLPDAVAQSGFKSLEYYAESCKAAGFVDLLKGARVKAVCDSSEVEQARVAQRRYALQAAECVRQLG
jgi:hypothetical protein